MIGLQTGRSSRWICTALFIKIAGTSVENMIAPGFVLFAVMLPSWRCKCKHRPWPITVWMIILVFVFWLRSKMLINLTTWRTFTMCWSILDAFRPQRSPYRFLASYDSIFFAFHLYWGPQRCPRKASWLTHSPSDVCLVLSNPFFFIQPLNSELCASSAFCNAGPILPAASISCLYDLCPAER